MRLASMRLALRTALRKGIKKGIRGPSSSFLPSLFYLAKIFQVQIFINILSIKRSIINLEANIGSVKGSVCLWAI